MHHRTIRASTGGNLSGVRCEKLQRPYLVQDPWLSSSMRMDEWEFPRADSLGAVPETWKTQMGASYEGYSKRGTCTRCQHSPLSTSQPGGVGGLNTEADASTVWLSAAPLAPWLINCPDARSVGWWTTCTVLRTARCIGAQHLVLVLRNRLRKFSCW